MNKKLKNLIMGYLIALMVFLAVYIVPIEVRIFKNSAEWFYLINLVEVGLFFFGFIVGRMYEFI